MRISGMPNQSSLLSLLALFLLGVSAQGRLWTDSLGRKFEATLVKASKNSVVLDVSGQQRTFLHSQLSAEDRAFISSATGAAPRARAAIPPAKPKPQPRTGNPVQIQADTSIHVQRLRADPPNKRWVYGSPNFEFICDQDLGIAVVRQFAWMFESVWQFCERFPYYLPRLKAAQKVRMKTYLIANYQDYVRLGGPPRTAGVYLTAQDVILIPFVSLGITEANGKYQVDKSDGNYTLRHELAHQLMAGQTQQTGWFIEGSAEYVCTVPYRQNRMLLSHHQKSVVEYLTGAGWQGSGGYNLGRNLELNHLENFMQPSYAAFQQQPLGYPYSLLLYYYFAKFDGDKKGTRLARYVAALQDGRPEVDAREALLDGRSYQALEADFVRAWNQIGIRITFK